MQGNIHKRGQYELFETTKGHQILNLNDKEFYAVVEGQRGDILVRSDADHQKSKTIRKGRFYLADFNNDPRFNDIPHLFLQENEHQYQEWILPQDVPSAGDHQKKLVRTDKKVSKAKIDHHTTGGGKKVREKQHHSATKQADGHDAAAGGKKNELNRKNKSELYALAKGKKIVGRSSMDKNELIDALLQSA